MKNRAMRIRRARSTDLKHIMALVDSYEKHDGPFALRYFKRYFARDPLLAKDRLYVAEINGEVIGVSGYYLDHFVTDYSYWLSWFIVSEQYRGHRDGLVASKMLSHLIRRLKRLGVRKVFVATQSSNGRGVRFYLKRGFEVEARLSDYYYRDEDQLILGRYL